MMMICLIAAEPTGALVGGTTTPCVDEPPPPQAERAMRSARAVALANGRVLIRRAYRSYGAAKQAVDETLLRREAKTSRTEACGSSVVARRTGSLAIPRRDVHERLSVAAEVRHTVRSNLTDAVHPGAVRPVGGLEAINEAADVGVEPAIGADVRIAEIGRASCR